MTDKEFIQKIISSDKYDWYSDNLIIVGTYGPDACSAKVNAVAPAPSCIAYTMTIGVEKKTAYATIALAHKEAPVQDSSWRTNDPATVKKVRAKVTDIEKKYDARVTARLDEQARKVQEEEERKRTEVLHHLESSIPEMKGKTKDADVIHTLLTSKYPSWCTATHSHVTTWRTLHVQVTDLDDSLTGYSTIFLGFTQAYDEPSRSSVHLDVKYSDKWYAPSVVTFYGPNSGAMAAKIKKAFNAHYSERKKVWDEKQRIENERKDLEEKRQIELAKNQQEQIKQSIIDM